MRIANPIYDVVFKYLLDEEKVARLMLSALLGQEVLELDFRPTEVRQEVQDPQGTEILVFRLDFKAALRMEDGSRKLVLIEIQKAQSVLDLLRFRRYLGANYCSEESGWRDEAGAWKALPLITIYFLGQGLATVDVPILSINRHYLDRTTGDEVLITDPFVEALTHDSIVVQINRLKNRRRTELERLLAVFDQGQACRSDPHILDILADSFPERYREVLRRLEKALGDTSLHQRMDLEDEIEAAFKIEARKLADVRKVCDQQDNVIGEQARTMEEQARTMEEQARAMEEKDRLIEELRRHLSR